jgi:hypothetical protein
MVSELRKRLVGHIVVEAWDVKLEGNVVCALRAFELGLDCFKGQPFTVLQDDAELCDHFADYAQAFVADVMARNLIIQWYAHGWVAGSLQALNGDVLFEQFGGRDYVCSLATTYPHEWAEKIRDYLKDQVEHDGVRDDFGKMHGDDQAIADVLSYNRKEFYVHIPSLVQHVGHVSMVAGRHVSLESHDARTSRCYVGKDFDARTLLSRVNVPWRKQTREDNMTTKHTHEHVKHDKDEDTVKDVPVVVEPPSSPPPMMTPAPTLPNCNVCGDTSGTCEHTDAA